MSLHFVRKAIDHAIAVARKAVTERPDLEPLGLVALRGEVQGGPATEVAVVSGTAEPTRVRLGRPARYNVYVFVVPVDEPPLAGDSQRRAAG